MTSVQSATNGMLSDVIALLRAAAGADGSAERVLAPDVRSWFADPGHGIAASVLAVDGADATRELLVPLAPSELTVVGSVASARACWAELTRQGDADGDGDGQTCIVGLTFDAARLIRRLVLLLAPLVPAPATARSKSAPAARAVLEAYFDDLMNSRFRAAASHFSADALYSHPPYPGGSERILFSGRDAIWRGFAVERGSSPARQVITGCWQRGDRAFIEGVIEGIPDGGSFFSTAQLNSDGEIARYVAFYSAMRIPSS